MFAHTFKYENGRPVPIKPDFASAAAFSVPAFCCFFLGLRAVSKDTIGAWDVTLLACSYLNSAIWIGAACMRHRDIKIQDNMRVTGAIFGAILCTALFVFSSMSKDGEIVTSSAG